MIICELEFEREDPNKKGYSMDEIDYYEWAPATQRNHRLSLRKNLITGEFEVYKCFWTGQDTPTGIIPDVEQGEEQVMFKTKSLAEAVQWAREETEWVHPSWQIEDKICKHLPGEASSSCPRLQTGQMTLM